MHGPDGHDGGQQKVEQVTSSEEPCPSSSILSKKRAEGEDWAASGNMRDALECFKAALQLIATQEMRLSSSAATTISVKTAGKSKKVNQQTGELYEMMAQCFMEIEDYGAAIAHAKHATHALPAWRHGYHTLARAQLCAGKFAAAIKSFERAIACFTGEIPSDDAERRGILEELAEAQSLSRRQQIQQHDKDLPTRGDQLVLRIRPCAPALTDLVDCDGEADEDVDKFGGKLNESTGIGTGGSIWEAGAVMAMWINTACKRSPMAGKHTPGVGQTFLQETQILELGSGTGLVGLAAAAAGGACVLTDLPDVLRASTADNVERNRSLSAKKGIVLQVELRPLDWNTFGSKDFDILPIKNSGAGSANKHAKPAFDLVLGSDLVFNSKAIAPVVRMVVHFAAQGAAVILSHKLRHDSVDGELFSSIRAAGMRLHEVRSNALDPAFRTPRVACVFIHSPTVELRPQAARALSILDPSFAANDEPKPPTPSGAQAVARSIQDLQDSIRRYSQPADGACTYLLES